MLNTLSIKNFALIEDVNLSLENGFTTITGETGAGKSILLGALALLLGKRADLNAVRNSEKKCIIEGVFSIGAYQLQQVFQKNDIDYEPQTIVRREILPSGKSRAFINDTPVNLQQMSVLGNALVDIHSQHDTLFIGNSDYQYTVIDALASNNSLRKKYTNAYKKYTDLLQALAQAEARQKEASATYDYHLFLLNELQEVKLKKGMQEELEAEYNQLNNVETVKENLSASLYLLEQEEIGMLQNLQELKNRLTTLENYGEHYRELSERVKSTLIEIEDIGVEINQIAETIEDDPERLAQVNEKLQQLYNLHKKHNTSSEEELLQLQENLSEKVHFSEHAEESLAQLHQEIETAKQHTLTIGNQLYESRKSKISYLTNEIEKTLAKVGMPDAQLKISLTKQNTFHTHGTDLMSWEFSANKGGKLQPIKKAASGGELSRITLAIKSILANYSQLPTIIFDEIDTGVSGEIAQKMGDIMAEMGQYMQVISITHLPQIAAKGDNHLKVYKKTTTNTTATNISTLTTEQRIEELAEMLGGKENKASARTHAKALLE